MYIQQKWENLLLMFDLSGGFLEKTNLYEVYLNNKRSFNDILYYNYYLAAIFEIEDNRTLFRDFSKEKLYLDKLEEELKQVEEKYSSYFFTRYIDFIKSFELIGDGHEFITKLLEANHLLYGEAIKYLHSFKEELFSRMLDDTFEKSIIESRVFQEGLNKEILTENPDENVENETCKVEYQLKKLFREEEYYNLIVEKLKSDVVEECNFDRTTGKFYWTQNRKKEYLIGFAKRLYDKNRLKNELIKGNFQILQRSFTSFFNIYIAPKSWQPENVLNNTKGKKYTFITDFDEKSKSK